MSTIKHPVDLEAEARADMEKREPEKPKAPPPPNTSYKGYPSRQVYRWAMRKGYR